MASTESTDQREWRSRIVSHGEAEQHTGMASCCAECKRTYNREYMRRRRVERPEIREAERLRASAAYRADPSKGIAASRAWRERNPDKVKVQNDRRDPKFLKELWKRYYAENTEKLIERARLRRQTHPEDKRRSQAKRKAFIRGSVVALTVQEIDDIRSQPCLNCGKPGPNTLAHDVPVSRGGATTAENCFSLCSSCNSRMHTKTLAEMGWLQEVTA